MRVENWVFFAIFCYHKTRKYVNIEGDNNMNKKRSLQKLTFKDTFTFGAVMLDLVNCKRVTFR